MKNLGVFWAGCLFAALCVANHAVAAERETILFPSHDRLMVTADIYIAHENKNTPFIVLFHQAGWSRGEYREIAPRLNALGFNCMAVDLRSGNTVNGVRNHTAYRAKTQKKAGGYVDALPDVEFALRVTREFFGKGKVIAWGSSYSASLVLKIAANRPDLVDGVLAFAPGEYFAGQGKPKTWIQDSAKTVHVPVFVTSARNEKAKWQAIFDALPSKDKVAYIPQSAGNHGSRALWKEFDDSEGYWKAVEAFLNTHFK